MTDSRPYRPNVGVALFAPDGRVLVARRIGDDGPESISAAHRWQMPQGGVDPQEDLEAAARRELWEETGAVSVEILGRLAPMRYEFPPYYGPPHKLAAFRGQEQTWFAMRFVGDEREIDVAASRCGDPIEFDLWRWERLALLPSLVVPFKRDIYARVAADFAHFAVAANTA